MPGWAAAAENAARLNRAAAKAAEQEALAALRTAETEEARDAALQQRVAAQAQNRAALQTLYHLLAAPAERAKPKTTLKMALAACQEIEKAAARLAMIQNLKPEDLVHENRRGNHRLATSRTGVPMTCIAGVNSGSVNPGLAFIYSTSESVSVEDLPPCNGQVDAVSVTRRLEQMKPDMIFAELSLRGSSKDFRPPSDWASPLA